MIARGPREVVLLERAKRDLMAIQAVERRMLVTTIDRLAMDCLPRGVERVESALRDHLRVRVGRFRVIYAVDDGILTVVAVLE